MFGWLKRFFEERKTRKRLEQDLRPESFLRLAEEVAELARVAMRVCPEQEELLARIETIQKEMDGLAEMAAKKEFAKLSAGRRILLRQGVLQARDQILSSMQAAPTPTDRLQ